MSKLVHRDPMYVMEANYRGPINLRRFDRGDRQPCTMAALRAYAALVHCYYDGYRTTRWRGPTPIFWSGLFEATYEMAAKVTLATDNRLCMTLETRTIRDWPNLPLCAGYENARGYPTRESASNGSSLDARMTGRAVRSTLPEAVWPIEDYEFNVWSASEIHVFRKFRYPQDSAQNVLYGSHPDSTFLIEYPPDDPPVNPLDFHSANLLEAHRIESAISHFTPNRLAVRGPLHSREERIEVNAHYMTGERIPFSEEPQTISHRRWMEGLDRSSCPPNWVYEWTVLL